MAWYHSLLSITITKQKRLYKGINLLNSVLKLQVNNNKTDIGIWPFGRCHILFQIMQKIVWSICKEELRDKLFEYIFKTLFSTFCSFVLFKLESDSLSQSFLELTVQPKPASNFQHSSYLNLPKVRIDVMNHLVQLNCQLS